jgi:hypothetical protein
MMMKLMVSSMGGTGKAKKLETTKSVSTILQAKKATATS